MNQLKSWSNQLKGTFKLVLVFDKFKKSLWLNLISIYENDFAHKGFSGEEETYLLDHPKPKVNQGEDL